MTGTTPVEVVAPVAAAPVIAAPATDNVTPAATGVTLATPSTGSGVVAQPSVETTTWLATLDVESRELAEKKNWKGPADGFKSYRELEQAFSSRSAPEATATYKADDYKFAIPANAKELGYSETFANAFRDMSVKTGLAPEAAAAVHDWYTNFASEAVGTQTAARDAQLSAQIAGTEADLTKAWGSPNNPMFKRNVELAQRAMSQLGVMDAMVEAGALVDVNGTKTVANAKLFEMFAKVGAGMYAEDTLHGAPAMAGVNPFDPKTEDMSAQSTLVKNDPEKALLLIGALPEAQRAMWQAFIPSIQDRAKRQR